MAELSPLLRVKKQFQKCISLATLVCALLAINPAINSKCLEEGGIYVPTLLLAAPPPK